MAARPSSPFPLIAGIGGGALVLVLIIAAAASGGREEPPPPPPVVPPPPPPEPGRAVEDTGPILFICSNSPKHPDKEQLLSDCPHCPTRSRFYWDSTTENYRCFSCRRSYPKTDIKCPDCGKVPRVHRIKHRPG